ncbi:MAG: DUF4293 family protein [Bacteroidaceae bacterium]|nr:DUF4293 family protein [Bacteroidaceae bacterium]
MKFRPYQLFYVISLVLLIASLFISVAQFIESNGATSVLGNFSLVNPDGSNSYSVCALGVVLSFTALVELFALFVASFQNFELQKRLSIFVILLLTGYYILLLIVSLLIVEGSEVYVQLAMLLPFIALVLNVMAFMAVRRTEAAILARAAGFRLRD